MSETTPSGSKGLFESLTVLAGSMVVIVHTRLELLSADLEEDRSHLLSLLVLTLVALFCLGVAVVLVMILLVITFWDTHRLLSLGVIAGCFLAVGMVAWVFALHMARSKTRLFAASLTELSKDRQQLIARS